MRSAIAAGRAVTAGSLAWMGTVHFHLWQSGYRDIHVIGPLFLLNFILALAVALAVLAAPRRLLPYVALAAVGLAAGTLAGLLISVNDGLFGFRDSLSAPFAHESIVAEAVVIVSGLGLSGGGLLRRHPRPAVRAG